MSPSQTALATQAERFNPFPGLRPFEPDEDYLFFGREQQLDALLRRLRTTRFLAIVGTSGSGKSSLVRAGLIPSLYGGAMARAGSSWRVAILRPGEDPVGNLAAALSAPEALAQKDTDKDLTRPLFETILRSSKIGLIDCIRQAGMPARDNVLVLVDQFEEIFRFKESRKETSRDEAVGFVKLLLAAARHPEARCYIAMTMRSDFIDNCMELGNLPETVNAGLYLVPRMTRDELRSAITGPVAVGGGAIAPRLVSRLLNDVGDDPDQLPILQHALLRTWNRWDEDHEPGEPLDLRHYEATGTMKEALSRHAEEAYGELDEHGRRIAEQMFKALTDRRSDSRGIRRPERVSEICALTGASLEEVATVVDSFRRPGRSFLMPPADVPLRDSSILDLAHESLMRIWDRMATWVDEEGRSARLYLGVARAASHHAEGTAALWRDPELQLALTWRETEKPTPEWARRYDPAFERAMAFLDASKAERDQGSRERETRRRRELRRARVLALILGTAALVTFVLGGYAYVQKLNAETELSNSTFQRDRATHEQERAERQRQEALRQKRSAEQQGRFAEAERSHAERQSQVAGEQRRIAEIERRNAESKELEARAQKAAAEAAGLEAEGQRAEAVGQRELADRLRTEAEASEREQQRLSRLSLSRSLAFQTLRLQQEDQRELSALLALQAYRLNRDNQGEPEDPDLFNALRTALNRLQPETVLRGHLDGVRALALGPDGRTLVSGGEDGKVLLFDLSRPKSPPITVGSFSSGVRSLALDGGGTLIAAGGTDGLLWIWDLRKLGAPPRELPVQGTGAVGSLAFQPGGPLLAAASADGAVRLWNPDRPESPTALLAGGGKRVTAAAFSPNGRTLAAGMAQGGGALLWDVHKPSAQPQTVCAGQDIRSLAFSPDGLRLACGTGRGRILLTDVGQPETTSVALTGHTSSVNDLGFSPRRDFLASASSDGSVRLWNLQHPDSQPIVLDGHQSWVWAIELSADGEKLISGGEDRLVRIWPARTSAMAGELCQSLQRGLTKDEWHRYMPPDFPYSEDRPCPR